MDKKSHDDPDLKLKTTLSEKKWRAIFSHTETEIKGFFGDYRFLSNFWPARVFLDRQLYQTVENAYQAAKFPKSLREPFYLCHPKKAIILAATLPGKLPEDEWTNEVRLKVMEDLVFEKFHPVWNPENHPLLIKTSDKYLEETNYWEDIFWGVYKQSKDEPGVGENNLGKLLMKTRAAF